MKSETKLVAGGCGGIILSLAIYLGLLAAIVYIVASIVHAVFA